MPPHQDQDVTSAEQGCCHFASEQLECRGGESLNNAQLEGQGSGSISNAQLEDQGSGSLSNA